MLLALLVVGGSAQTPPPRPQASPRLRFESPSPDIYAAGRIVLRVALDDAAGEALQDVTFFADGTQVCVARAARPECAWEAGQDVREHLFRAVARLQSGRRVIATVRTRGLGFVDSAVVEIVPVNAVVTNGGRFVTGLPKEAFRILDEGRPQPITSFSPAGEPLEVVLALDVSASMQNSIGAVRDAARAFLQGLGPNDRATIIAFNDQAFTLTMRETDPAVRLGALDRLSASGSTALYDVIVHALQMLADQTGRRALVVFSDGDDRSSATSFDAVQQSVRESDATVFAVGLGRGADIKELRARLEELADASGGQALFAERTERLAEPFARIIADLQNQYSLGFVPQRDGRFHAIQVDVPGQNVRVRARRGYMAPKPRQ
jgi:Ca-activated chloride channel homolog